MDSASHVCGGSFAPNSEPNDDSSGSKKYFMFFECEHLTTI